MPGHIYYILYFQRGSKRIGQTLGGGSATNNFVSETRVTTIYSIKNRWCFITIRILVQIFNNNEDNSRKLTFVYVKNKNISRKGGCGYHPYPNSAELDRPYFRMQLTVHTVSLTEMIYTSIS